MTLRWRRSHRLVALATLSLMFVSAKAKDKQDHPEAKFTARTELVLIPTLVTDKSGNHITGLKKEDFTVLEDGAEQNLATFEEMTSNPQRFVPARSPNEFSNFIADQPSTRITIIVLDFINTSFADQAAARQELLKYLTQSVDEREPTALYTLTRDGIQVIHDFTTDPRVLVTALHRVKGDAYEMVDSPEDVEGITGTASPDGSPSYPGEGKGGRGSSKGQGAVQGEVAKIQRLFEDAELNFQAFEQRLAITYTLQGMQQIAQALVGFPGRKSLIWASGGFPFSVSDNTMQLARASRDSLTDVLPMYERTWQLLNDAQVSLYPVDVKGLQMTNLPSAAVRNPGTNYRRHATWKQEDTESTFQTFASMTGGRAYFNSNDLVRGFRDAVNDSSQYYMLGYYLDHSKTKSGWRKLAIKVKRDHSEVRARNGFFVTNATSDPEITRKSDISSALLSPLDYTALSFAAHWNKMEAGNEPGRVRANYEMDLLPVAGLIDEADDNHLAVDFVALVLTPEGKPAGEPVDQKVDAHLTAERLTLIRQKGVGYSGTLDLAPGEYTVRFVVRNDLDGRMGSVTGPLQVE
jgi:VWFA-related protein